MVLVPLYFVFRTQLRRTIHFRNELFCWPVPMASCRAGMSIAGGLFCATPRIQGLEEVGVVHDLLTNQPCCGAKFRQRTILVSVGFPNPAKMANHFQAHKWKKTRRKKNCGVAGVDLAVSPKKVPWRPATAPTRLRSK